MKKYGLIGRSLDHSFSPAYFSEKFFLEGIEDCEYKAYPLPDLQDFDLWISDVGLDGFNVTIPYKEEIIDWLDELDPLAKAIGAVNCVLRKGDRLIGFNTDVAGIEHSLKMMGRKFNSAMILGTGGAAKALHYVLEQEDIQIMQIGRNSEKADIVFDDLRLEDVHEVDLIVNCTPLGTYPNEDSYPPIPYEALHEGQWLFDLVYNPERTRFLQYGAARGARTLNGHSMLVAQAEASWNIWTEL